MSIPNGAVSAYAPLRRNSFLEHPPASTSTTLASGFSTLTLGLTLVIIRFWNDARLWQELVSRLPKRWQSFLSANLQKWRHCSLQAASTKSRELLEALQEQLAPFLAFSASLTSQSASVLLAPPDKKNMVDNNFKAGLWTGRGGRHGRSLSGDAPTSILCDASSTQFTQQCWSDYYEDRIRQNQSLIRRVLAYWFGKFDPDIAQKKLWMIAAQCKDYRATVDSEIADLFTPLLCELAAAALPDVDASGDQQTFESAHLQGAQQQYQPSSSRWTQWCADKDMYGYQGKLAAIIVLDQFSRHIRRHYEDSSTTLGALPPQHLLDKLSLRTGELLTEAHELEIKCGMIPLPQYVFGLMPYRHANTLDSVQYVQTCVEHAASLNLQLEDMTSRFRKATNRRMAGLQDEARRTGKVTTIRDNPSVIHASHGSDANVEISMGQSDVAFSDDDILEAFPFDADTAEAGDHVVVKAIRSFLADRGIQPVPSTQNGNAKNANHARMGLHASSGDENSNKNPRSTSATNASSTPCSLIVSLSGGVDSMVIASVLTYLKSGPYPHLEIVAIHIDYANRPESKAESDFVERYCRQHGIRFVVRRIEEVTRGITARDEYERCARQVRYDMYRAAVAEERAKHKGNKGKEVGNMTVGVMLGHHRGDLRENVLSNAHKGCGPLDLSGMTAVSQNDGVTILRPLLPLEKTSIFDYAHRYGVPYFKGKCERRP
jgi:tRNA(Ile)-lysidine synthetase-like protein